MTSNDEMRERAASDVIELAAQVLCDSTPQGKRWDRLGVQFRDLYRARVRELADAGLLAAAYSVKAGA